MKNTLGDSLHIDSWRELIRDLRRSPAPTNFARPIDHPRDASELHQQENDIMAQGAHPLLYTRFAHRSTRKLRQPGQVKLVTLSYRQMDVKR